MCTRHARTHARTHTQTHTRTRARTHRRTHIRNVLPHLVLLYPQSEVARHSMSTRLQSLTTRAPPSPAPNLPRVSRPPNKNKLAKVGKGACHFSFFLTRRQQMTRGLGVSRELSSSSSYQSTSFTQARGCMKGTVLCASSAARSSLRSRSSRSSRSASSAIWVGPMKKESVKTQEVARVQ